MREAELTSNMKEFRLALVDSDGAHILLHASDGGSLPSVFISPLKRPARELQLAVKQQLGCHILTLAFLPSRNDASPGVVGRLMEESLPTTLVKTPLSRISHHCLSQEERDFTRDLLRAPPHDAPPTCGYWWIKQAVEWVESETRRRVGALHDVEQYSAGAGFSLLRIPMRRGPACWLKATGKPNMHERDVTRCLAAVVPDWLPQLIADRSDWNSWLMSDAGRPLADTAVSVHTLTHVLKQASTALARLQLQTIDHVDKLLGNGAYDQSLDVFETNSSALFDYLAHAMQMQQSTKVPPLTRKRLTEIRGVLHHACAQSRKLGLPGTIGHGDLNLGNLIVGPKKCTFLDWSEAYIGFPFVSFQHLALLHKNLVGESHRKYVWKVMRKSYIEVWSQYFDREKITQGLRYAPLLAIASTLYGRGGWWHSERGRDVRYQAYARALARHMDRAAQTPPLRRPSCA